MRLNVNLRRACLTLAPNNQPGVIGIADAVARAVAHGPGALPAGVAHGVLRLAFGPGVGAAVDPAEALPLARQHRDRLPLALKIERSAAIGRPAWVRR